MANTNTINNNDIKQFILRIDFQTRMPTEKIVTDLKCFFQRLEERKLLGFEVSLDTQNKSSSVEQKNFTDIVMVGDDGKTFVLSPKENCLYLQSNVYIDNSVYKDIVKALVAACRSEECCQAKRIGLRYINELECKTPRSFNAVLNKKFATVIKNMLTPEDTTRAIAVQFRTVNEQSLKVQYGVFNKFFPSVLKNYDIVIDIDSFSTSLVDVHAWESIITSLNHNAFATFAEMVSPIYMEKKKNG